jgi:type III pantothenate kinase
MNLVIDIGNTLTKAAIFHKNTIVEKKVLESIELIKLPFLFNDIKDIDSVIISSVRNYRSTILKDIFKKAVLIELDENTPLPVTNKYMSPDTLGKDRIASAIGGRIFYSDKNLLVINAGTCITYDFITENNEYIGGAISPGIQMRLKALNVFTSRLPMVDIKGEFDKLIGQTTEESILSGVVNGIVSEIEGICRRYKEIYPRFKAILTGGDYLFLEKQLKNRIFAEPDLVLTGLNIILNFNIKKNE